MKEILFFGYIALISSLSVVICIYDKLASKQSHAQRIRERTLCLFSLAGGALAMLLTMLWIRHKTKHTGIIVLSATAALLWLIVYSVIFAVFVI